LQGSGAGHSSLSGEWDGTLIHQLSESINRQVQLQQLVQQYEEELTELRSSVDGQVSRQG